MEVGNTQDLQEPVARSVRWGDGADVGDDGASSRHENVKECERRMGAGRKTKNRIGDQGVMEWGVSRALHGTQGERQLEGTGAE